MYGSQSILFIDSISEKEELLDDLYLICYTVGERKIPRQLVPTIIASLVLEHVYLRADMPQLGENLHSRVHSNKKSERTGPFESIWLITVLFPEQSP